MSDWTIKGRTSFSGEIEAPGDKSVSHRAVILGAISEGETTITNFLTSDDCKRTIAAFQEMGIFVQHQDNGDITIKGGKLQEPEMPLDMGNSGTGVRLLAGLLAGQPFLSILTGDESIRRRPMRRVCEPLRKMGATMLARSGDLCPLVIRGSGLKGIEYTSPVASAQVKSCLLFAGQYADGPTTVIEPSLSRDHTERMLRAFGGDIMREGNAVTIRPGSALKGRNVFVPGDISSAAFFIVGALITPDSELKIRNVGTNPTRTGIIDALREMNADITLEDQQEVSGEPVATLVVKTSALKGSTFGGDLIPRMIDEIPVLSLAAAFAEGETVIRDAQELRVKESDRIATVSATLSAFGAQVEGQPDGLIVQGGSTMRTAVIDSRGDHRIAMMAAIAGKAIEGETLVKDTEYVNTSFPNFTQILQTAAP